MRNEVELAAKDPSNGATKGASTTRIKMERMEKAKRHRQLVKDVAFLSSLVGIVGPTRGTGNFGSEGLEYGRLATPALWCRLSARWCPLRR